MSHSTRDSKPRVTKNSQRLYNLEEQERLYRNLGITKMAEIPQNSENQEEDLEEGVESGKSGDEGEGTRPDEKGSRDENKSKKRRSKDSHIMSDSESDQDKELENYQDQEPEKKRRKKKIKLVEKEFSPKVTRGKKAKVQTGALPKRGKKSPLTAKGKAKKGNVNLSQPAIKLPGNLLESPEDSSLIAAHMNAYTKWLLENDMLVSQQSLNRFAQHPGTGNSSTSEIKNQGASGVAGFTAPAPVLSKTQVGNDDRMLNPHDISTDESSNVDASELDGQPPFIPKTISNKNKSGENLMVPPPVVNQANGELFNVCEAEKDVPLEEDSLLGPEVSEQLALMIKNFLGRNRKAAKIDDLLSEFIRPKNMPFLKPPFIEEEIYFDLATGARHFDKNCRLLQGYIFAAITALTSSLQSLILTEKLHPIITDAGVKVKKALQLLAFSTKEINDRRKDALKSSVNQEYLPLLKHAKPPSDDWLLGGDLSDAIKKCDDSKKLSEKIMKNKKALQQQNTQGQNQNFQQQQANNSERFKYRNRGKKDSKSYYRNYQQSQGNQQGYSAPYVQQQQQNQQFVQPAVQQQQNQLHLWQQYQQQLQQAQAQAIQNQSQNRQNLGFQQNQQWRDQNPQYQGYNSNAYNQKKKN